MPATCFDCGEVGHVAGDCPNRELNSDGKPPWCGICDPRTRLTGLGPDGPLARCTVCHPKRGEWLKQHKRCQSCKMLILEWDTSPCGSHSSPVDHRLPREEIDAIVAREMAAENHRATVAGEIGAHRHDDDGQDAA